MSDYKNLDDVIMEIKRFKGYLDDDMITRLTIAIDRIPSADVAEVRHAEWQLIHRGKDFCKDVYRCSECGFLVTGIQKVAYAYCYNCGAKMDGEEHE